MPFTIRADADVQGYSFSLDFDEEILEALQVEKVFPYPGGSVRGFEKVEINNASAHPGSGGVDEGFIIGALVFSFDDRCHNMPANRENEALRIQFRVRPEATVSSTEVRFLDGGQGSGQPVRNSVTAFGTTVLPELASSFVFLDGVINVQPDITTFIRGDSTGDGVLDISDPQRTLGFLFLGNEPPACYDAADADDNGNLDIGDPIRTLTALFLGGGSLPAPYPEAGEDPTGDTMGCLFR